jgi:hypothetical protein
MAEVVVSHQDMGMLKKKASAHHLSRKKTETEYPVNPGHYKCWALARSGRAGDTAQVVGEDSGWWSDNLKKDNLGYGTGGSS